MGHLAERILALHGWVALLIVFLAPALEASAFVGVVFPGEIAVLLGGVLAFQHRVPLPAVLAAAIGGAIIGDSAGYLVGRRWGRRLLHGSIGRVVKHDHIDRAERLLARHGGKAVFIGRFTAALRALIPGLAGMAKLPYRSFLVYNVAGGTLWAGAFVLLGYAAGTSWRRVEAVAKDASLLVLLALAAGGAIVLVARRIASHPDQLRAFAERQLARPPLARVRARYRRQLAFLARRLRPGGALGLSLTVSMLALVATGWAFGALLQDVLAGEESTLVDRPFTAFLVAHREAWLTRVMRLVTDLGSTWLLLGLVLAAGLAWRWRRGTWRPLALLGAAEAGAWSLANLLKVLVARPRPPVALALVRATGPGFPSAHAAGAAAVYGMLAALLAGATSSWSRKVAVWAGAFALAGLVAGARVYLGVHWLTDVLGGLALGAAWLFALLGITRTVKDVRGG